MRAYHVVAGPLIALLFVPFALAWAETITQNATSSIAMQWVDTPDGAALTTQEVRTWFDLGVAEIGCDYATVLLRNEVRISSRPLSAMEQAIDVDRLEVIASIATASGVGKPLYTLALEGDGNTYSDAQSAEISTDSGFLAIALGNSDIWNWSIYDLATGTFLGLAETPYGISSLGVEGDCKRKRFTAVSNLYAPDAGVSYSGEGLARITYAGTAGPIAQVILSATDAAIAASGLNAAGGVRLDANFRRINSKRSDSFALVPARGDDRATFADFTLWIRLPNDTGINIPVIGDAPDLGRAELPDGFFLTLDPLQATP